MCMAMVVMYFILFGSIWGDVMKSGLGTTHPLLASEAFSKILVALVLLPLVLKKELKEVKAASVLLVSSLIAFVIVFGIQLLSKNIFYSERQFYEINSEIQPSIVSVANLMVAFAF